MLDAIISKISEWFSDHRNEAAAVPVEHKLVPFVENFLHDIWKDAEKLKVKELNWFERIYDVIAKTDAGEANHFTVNLRSKSCSYRVFDIEKYPCVHALGIMKTEITISNYMSCARGITGLRYGNWHIADECLWNVPRHVKQLQIIPKNKDVKKGRKKVLRFPDPGERRPRTKNKRRKRQGLFWLLFRQNGYVG